jgi:anti-sigma B factor antagonist
VGSDLAPELTVREEWDGNEVTVEVSGEIDFGTVGAFSARLHDVAGRSPKRLVIDLSGVAFVDSSGLHAFVRVRKDLPESCPVVLRSPRRQIRQVFDITGLAPAFAFE